MKDKNKDSQSGGKTNGSLLVKWGGGIVAFLAIVATATGHLENIVFSKLMSGFDSKEYKIVLIDSEYIAVQEGNIWDTPDVTIPPINKLKQGTVIRVRGEIKEKGLYAIEQSSNKLGYISKIHLVKTSKIRTNLQREDVNYKGKTDGDQAARKLLFGVRAGAMWEEKLKIYENPSLLSSVVGILDGGNVSSFDYLEGQVDVLDSFEGSNWIEIGVGGKSIGFIDSISAQVSWPTGVISYSGVGEEIVTSFVSNTGATVRIKRGPTYLRLETKIMCESELCNSVYFYSTSRKKTKGPRHYMGRSILGSWNKNEIVSVYLILPSDFIDTEGKDIISCIGNESGCKPRRVMKVSAPGYVVSGNPLFKRHNKTN